MAKKKVYAVKVGRASGLYQSWPEAERQIKGYPGARFKGFASEREAMEWMKGTETPRCLAPKVKEKSSVMTPPPQEGEVQIYTDGGALGNPGPGGYGVVLVRPGESNTELCQGFRRTTNNRMELLACIAGLRAIGKSAEQIDLFSDSSYVVNGIMKGWARNWRRRGWKKSDGQPALNPDLWAELLDLTEKRSVRFHWVKGHAGHPLNERCDELVRKAAKGDALAIDAEYEKKTS
ncbi:unnamed protein product [Cyprideis torosa]|uniref:Ribonuclease H n=1 Tax=Cyprideis torosa TaxID=163714 RepID=A0A7R8WR04_9CRUS|nr:unnamed protein product [Cyprideis torosa]CAG0906563.1 unnamed protein product [Cyprideis torosa]